MRNLIYAINISIDGCCEHTCLPGDEEVHRYFTNLMKEVDLLVYGRITYELMVPFWPDVARNSSGESNAITEFAHAFNAIKKIVFSSSLADTEEENTAIIRADLKKEILKLKQEPGKSILTGGLTLPSHLIELGLVDEYYIVVHPMIVGEGRRFLEGISLQDKLSLKLIDTIHLKSGSIVLRYQKK